jgi:hypothetical protein
LRGSVGIDGDDVRSVTAAAQSMGHDFGTAPCGRHLAIAGRVELGVWNLNDSLSPKRHAMQH